MVEQQRSGAATTRDGVTLQYTIRGDEQSGQPKIVLVHSLAMGGAVWDAVAERLASKAAVLTYDCRGHAGSTKAQGPYHLEGFARDLSDLLDHLKWDTINLAGASMGGNVSLQFAQLYQARVQRLGLVDTTAWYGADAPEKWGQRAKAALEKGLQGLLEFQESRWFTDGFRAQNGPGVQLCRSLFLANDVACFAATCGMLGAFDLRAGLPELRMPTAIVVGEEDYATPPDMARVLHAGIGGSTLQIVPKARHLTFVECPDVIAGALSELLGRAAPHPA